MQKMSFKVDFLLAPNVLQKLKIILRSNKIPPQIGKFAVANLRQNQFRKKILQRWGFFCDIKSNWWSGQDSPLRGWRPPPGTQAPCCFDTNDKWADQCIFSPWTKKIGILVIIRFSLFFLTCFITFPPWNEHFDSFCHLMCSLCDQERLITLTEWYY